MVDSDEEDDELDDNQNSRSLIRICPAGPKAAGGEQEDDEGLSDEDEGGDQL